MDKRADDIRITENPEGKTLYLDFAKKKKDVFVMFLFILVFVSVLSFIPGVANNSVNLASKILNILFLWAIFLAIYFLVYYPNEIIFLRNHDGSFIIRKQDWFFLKKVYKLNSEQIPRFVARRRHMIGGTIYVGSTLYQPIIRYKLNGLEQDLNLLLSSTYSMKGLGVRSTLSKDQATLIANELNLPLTFEE